MKQVAIISVVCLGLIGCGLMNMATGTNPDGTPSGGPNILESAGSVANILFGPGIGGLVGFAGGWATKAYRHKLLVAAGKRDDNFDGIEDAPDVKPAPPTSPDSSSPRAL